MFEFNETVKNHIFMYISVCIYIYTHLKLSYFEVPFILLYYL